MSRSEFIVLALLTLLPVEMLVGQETVYMSVLNSRRHRLGALDNPTVGLFISTDGGTSWHHRGWRGYIRTFYTEAGPDGTWWSACGNGVLRSTDQGATWKINTGWEITEVLKVRVDPQDPATVYTATAYGVFKTTDHGETWREKNNGFRKAFVSDILIVRSRRNQLLAATEEGVYRSTNGAEQWTLAGLKGKGVRVLADDPSNPSRIWLGTEEDGVFRSADGGRRWRASNAGLHHRTVYAIAVDPSNSNTIYLGTHGGGVYKSVDGGKTWEQRIAGLENLDVHALVLLRSNPSTVMAGTLNGGLFRSTDGGATWQFNSQEDAQVWGLSVR